MKTTPVAITAVFSGNIDTLKALTADDFKKTDELGRTAIHAACYKGTTPMLEHMIAALGDKAREVCDKQDNDGVTAALIVVDTNGKTKIILTPFTLHRFMQVKKLNSNKIDSKNNQKLITHNVDPTIRTRLFC